MPFRQYFHANMYLLLFFFPFLRSSIGRVGHDTVFEFLRHLGSHIPSLGVQVYAGYFRVSCITLLILQNDTLVIRRNDTFVLFALRLASLSATSNGRETAIRYRTLEVGLPTMSIDDGVMHR